jgi:hypothetical protein
MCLERNNFILMSNEVQFTCIGHALLPKSKCIQRMTMYAKARLQARDMTRNIQVRMDLLRPALRDTLTDIQRNNSRGQSLVPLQLGNPESQSGLNSMVIDLGCACCTNVSRTVARKIVRNALTTLEVRNYGLVSPRHSTSLLVVPTIISRQLSRRSVPPHRRTGEEAKYPSPTDSIAIGGHPNSMKPSEET